MYTVNILNIKEDTASGRIIARCEIVNAESKFEHKFTFPLFFTKEKIKREIKSFLDNLENSKSEIDTITVGALDLSDVVDVKPTQAEIDFVKWREDLNKLEQANRLIQLGVVEVSEPKYVALFEKVKTGFKPNYINKL